MNENWDFLNLNTSLESIAVGGIWYKTGDRVRIKPQNRADIMDLALTGQIAEIEAIERDFENRVYLALVLENDPGKDLGMMRQPGHRFFYAPNEVEHLGQTGMTDRRYLVAGIGNIFLGDDGFGVEVAQQLLRLDQPENVEVIDFGIRSYDLAYAMLRDYTAVILLDATQRGQAPGTVYLIELDVNQSDPASSELANAHSLNPVLVLTMVRMLGGQPRALYLVGCEPESFETDSIGLSEVVHSAIPEALTMVQTLITRLMATEEPSCTSLAS